MSPYLRDNPHNRTLDEVLTEKPSESQKHIEGVRKADTFMVACELNGQTFFRETDHGQTLNEVVADIADGQYDSENIAPVAVFRLSLADNEFEDYTGRAALLVSNYITTHAESKDDQLWHCPFLDNCWPGWKHACWRDWQAEEGYQEDSKYYARAGI